MDYASPALISVRRMGQRLGVLRPMQRLYRRLTNAAYEQAFDKAMAAEVRPGDTIWDIGANKGVYSVQFADWAGPSGSVLAFEPSPPVFADLAARTTSHSTIRPVQVALSDHEGVAMFDVRSHHHVGRLSDGGGVEVSVRRGDHFLDRGAPDVIKIDVEGFELEVLRGMPAAISSVRAVFIEVHFQELMQRGLTSAPKEMEAILQRAGLTTRWVDPSHLAAKRTTSA